MPTVSHSDPSLFVRFPNMPLFVGLNIKISGCLAWSCHWYYLLLDCFPSNATASSCLSTTQHWWNPDVLWYRSIEIIQIPLIQINYDQLWSIDEFGLHTEPKKYLLRRWKCDPSHYGWALQVKNQQVVPPLSHLSPSNCVYIYKYKYIYII